MRVSFFTVLLLVIGCAIPTVEGVAAAKVEHRKVKALVDSHAGFTKDQPVYLLIRPGVTIQMKRALREFEPIAKEEGLKLVPQESAEYLLLCNAWMTTGIVVGDITLQVYKFLPDKKRFDQNAVWEGSVELREKDGKDASAGIRALLSVFAEEYEGEAPRKKK